MSKQSYLDFCFGPKGDDQVTSVVKTKRSHEEGFQSVTERRVESRTFNDNGVLVSEHIVTEKNDISLGKRTREVYEKKGTASADATGARDSFSFRTKMRILQFADAHGQAAAVRKLGIVSSTMSPRKPQGSPREGQAQESGPGFDMDGVKHGCLRTFVQQRCPFSRVKIPDTSVANGLLQVARFFSYLSSRIAFHFLNSSSPSRAADRCASHFRRVILPAG